jgi:hypothetical protein
VPGAWLDNFKINGLERFSIRKSFLKVNIASEITGLKTDIPIEIIAPKTSADKAKIAINIAKTGFKRVTI